MRSDQLPALPARQIAQPMAPPARAIAEDYARLDPEHAELGNSLFARFSITSLIRMITPLFVAALFLIVFAMETSRSFLDMFSKACIFAPSLQRIANGFKAIVPRIFYGILEHPPLQYRSRVDMSVADIEIIMTLYDIETLISYVLFFCVSVLGGRMFAFIAYEIRVQVNTFLVILFLMLIFYILSIFCLMSMHTSDLFLLGCFILFLITSIFMLIFYLLSFFG